MRKHRNAKEPARKLGFYVRCAFSDKTPGEADDDNFNCYANLRLRVVSQRPGVGYYIVEIEEELFELKDSEQGVSDFYAHEVSKF